MWNSLARHSLTEHIKDVVDGQKIAEYAHLFVMPHVDKKLIDLLAADLAAGAHQPRSPTAHRFPIAPSTLP